MPENRRFRSGFKRLVRKDYIKNSVRVYFAAGAVAPAAEVC